MSRLGTAPGRVRVQPPPEAKQGKIYLGRLPTEGISNEDIETHFATFGSVAEVVRPVDKRKNNEPKNFAFVTFDREETAKELVEEGSTTINGIALAIPRVFFIDLSWKINISIENL